MARQKIKIMISSRCYDYFPLEDESSLQLSEIRKNLKKEIEAETLLGRKIFVVSINEDEPPEPADKDSLDKCLHEVRSADILLVLYNGAAGWSVNQTGNGICHDEWMTGYSESPGKVVLISLFEENKKSSPKNALDLRFQSEVNKINSFRGGEVRNIDQLFQRAKEAVIEIALKLMQDGAREAKQGGNNSGPALDWSRLNFSDRQKEMIKALKDSLSAMGKPEMRMPKIQCVFYPLRQKKILFVLSAIPSAFTVSAAREMVGQPFLKDHEISTLFTGQKAGPVHLIACQKNVTEAQAMKLLGFPDATIVQGSFGIYVSDNIQKIQLCLISNCTNEAATRQNVQRFLGWLDKTDEVDLLTSRAQSRTKIIKVITSEM